MSPRICQNRNIGKLKRKEILVIISKKYFVSLNMDVKVGISIVQFGLEAKSSDSLWSNIKFWYKEWFLSLCEITYVTKLVRSR